MAAAPAERDRVHGWDWPDAARTAASSRELLALEEAADPGLVADRWAGTLAARQTLSPTNARDDGAEGLAWLERLLG